MKNQQLQRLFHPAVRWVENVGSLIQLFLKKISDTDKYEEMEMDTGLLYLALAGKDVYHCIRGEKKQEW